MKKNVSKKILAAIFAVTLALGGGFLVAKSVQPKAEIVLAEPEDPEDPIDPEDPTDPEDPEDPEDPSDPEEPVDDGDEEVPAEGDGEGDGAAAPTEVTSEAPQSFFSAFINFVKDVINGMIAEFKALFGIK